MLLWLGGSVLALDSMVYTSGKRRTFYQHDFEVDQSLLNAQLHGSESLMVRICDQKSDFGMRKVIIKGCCIQEIIMIPKCYKHRHT